MLDTNRILQIVQEEISKNERPLEKLKTCKITRDGKYIIFENNAYFVRTGDRVPLNEEWSLSDILHTGADLLSTGLDFVFPGTGAIVDTLNAISYIIEAQFRPEEERDSLYLMAIVTFAFVALPGPLQAVSIPLKRFLKGGVSVATPAIKGALGIIYKSLDAITGRSLTLIQDALKSDLAKNILKKFGLSKILGYFNAFKNKIKNLLSKLLPNNVKLGAATAKVGLKNTLDKVAKTRLSTFVRNGFKVNKGSLLLRKLGFIPNKTYKFMAKSGKTYKATIRKYTDDSVELLYKGADGKSFVNTIKIKDFTNSAIGAPWSRRGYSAMVPLFVKRLTDFLDDNGVIDLNKMAQFPDLNPDDTSKETEEFASYEGDAGNYSVNTKVQTLQQALILLNYNLKGNDDGKFGPSTKMALEDFQKKNGLESSLGKMNKLTAKKLIDVLNTSKPQGKFNYTDVVSQLNSLIQ